jgi:mono/diheme cytochrome c family protein
MRRFVVFVVAITSAVALRAAAPQAPVAGNAANGQRVFEKDGCYQCHGYAAQGGRDGARLAATSMNAQSFTRYVRRPFGAMPAFTAKVLSDQELTDIYAYVIAMPSARPAKDIPLLNRLREK